MGAPLIYQRSVAQDLYVWALHSAYSGYRVYDPDYALLNEPDIFELVLRDPVINHAINLRLHGVAARRWRVLPASDREEDKKLAGVVEAGLGQIEGFTESRKNMALAVIRARTFQRVHGTRKVIDLGDLGEKDWWVPTRLREVDRRRFRIVPKWTEGVKRKLDVGVEMWSVERNIWEEMPLEEQKRYIKVIYNDEESRLGYGRGLCEALYFYHWAKGIVLEQCLGGIERWAQGMVTVKIDGLRKAAPANSNSTQANYWLQIIQKQRSKNSLVFDAKDDIEVHETQGTGHQLCMEMIHYLDDAMVALILGSVLPFGGGGGGTGSLARARTEREVSESLLQFDRDKIDEDIKRDLIGLFLRLNRPILEEVGLGKARTPVFETIQETHEDPEVNARVFAVLHGAGMAVRKDEAYAKVGYTPPKDGDEVIEGAVAPTDGEGGPGQPRGPGGTFGQKAKLEKTPQAKDDDGGRKREEETDGP